MSASGIPSLLALSIKLQFFEQQEYCYSQRIFQSKSPGDSLTEKPVLKVLTTSGIEDTRRNAIKS